MAIVLRGRRLSGNRLKSKIISWIPLVTFVAVQQIKPFLVHLSLLVVIILYLVVGALIFRSLEHKPPPTGTDDTGDMIWDFHDSLLFGFTVATTIGYGNISPATWGGQLFCVVYACIGIPMVMLFIASMGQHVEKGLYALCKAFHRRISNSDKMQKDDSTDDDDDFSSATKSILVLGVTFMYILIGAVLLPVYEEEMTVPTALYFNFITLTTIGLGDVVPRTKKLLPLTLVYIMFGLTLTTIAINVASEYLKVLHNVGRQLSNLAATKIWFGTKPLTVSKLVGALGKHFSISQDEIDNLDIDDLVHRALNEQSTRGQSVETAPKHLGTVIAEQSEHCGANPEDDDNIANEPPSHPHPPLVLESVPEHFLDNESLNASKLKIANNHEQEWAKMRDRRASREKSPQQEKALLTPEDDERSVAVSRSRPQSTSPKFVATDVSVSVKRKRPTENPAAAWEARIQQIQAASVPAPISSKRLPLKTTTADEHRNVQSVEHRNVFANFRKKSDE